MIVLKEQDGERRAEYGHKLIEGLSEYLREYIGKGVSYPNLKNARQFYLTYSDYVSPSSIDNSNFQKSQSVTGESYTFLLSWTHYLILMRIDNAEERRFYEIEAINQQWSVRQYNSCLYQRLALRRNKDEVLR